MTRKPRGRDLALPFQGVTGVHNAITDVPGIAVGVSTIVADAPTQVRTGVTAIIPHANEVDLLPVWAGFYALNGNGEMTGTHWINEAGYFKGPICITNTHSVGMAHHATVGWMLDRYRSHFDVEHRWAMPVIAETYDGVLNDINGQHVTAHHVRAALDGATSGPVAEGNVGGGTGMICYEFKGGTGTSSRQIGLVGQQHHIAALVQANHGVRDSLTVLGVPVGRHLRNDLLFPRETGSIIVVLATDLPLAPLQLRRVAKRAAIGIGRGGTPGGNNSGDIFLALSTANRIARESSGQPLWHLEFCNDDLLDPIFEAAVQCVEEAVINALLAAETATAFRPRGVTVSALPQDLLLEIMRQYGRLDGSPAG